MCGEHLHALWELTACVLINNVGSCHSLTQIEDENICSHTEVSRGGSRWQPEGTVRRWTRVAERWWEALGWSLAEALHQSKGFAGLGRRKRRVLLHTGWGAVAGHKSVFMLQDQLRVCALSVLNLSAQASGLVACLL